MSDSIYIRPVAKSELPEVLAMNERAIPHVSSVDLEAMEHFESSAPYFRVAVIDTRLVGFLIGLTPEADYASPNFLWFKERYPEFVYIDRIVIDESARRSGAGSALYHDIAQFAGPLAPRLTCEVNIRPRNEISLTFHEKHGFKQVGSQDTEGGTKTVAMLIKDFVNDVEGEGR